MTVLEEKIPPATERTTPARPVRRIIPLIALAAVLALLAAAPYLVTVTTILSLEQVAAFAVFAVAANLLIGQAGLVSFGQGVFFGLGAYTVTLGWEHAGLSFWEGFALAPVLGAAAAALIGLVALRARTLYFALITLAFSQLFYQLVEQNTGFTGGANGVFAPVVPAWMLSPVDGYLTLLAIAVAALAVLRWLYKSNFGLLLRASRENRARVQALGTNVYRLYLLAFTVSGAFCSLAGAMFVVYNQGSNAELFDWTTSGQAVLMSVIGGMYTFAGPVVGAFVYQFGHDWLVRFVSDWQLVLGGVLLLVVLLRPDGLAGALRLSSLRNRTRGRR
ncbi:MAG TPA: branched-chain amino acid ABC transporter permease [Actinospica sp.]|jgi:branched-chain amino acid transport system permease protein|nr:branched-chain amino acid ABC transporter permease [Actinospica sp.]